METGALELGVKAVSVDAVSVDDSGKLNVIVLQVFELLVALDVEEDAVLIEPDSFGEGLVTAAVDEVPMAGLE